MLFALSALKNIAVSTDVAPCSPDATVAWFAESGAYPLWRLRDHLTERPLFVDATERVQGRVAATLTATPLTDDFVMAADEAGNDET